MMMLGKTIRRSTLMLAGALLANTVVPCVAQAARDVTRPEERKKNLLEYIASREDLSSTQKAEFDRAIRLTFGGKAKKDGENEGITVAKSVLSSGIFFEIPIEATVTAAYDAYHDTFRWVPPPIAIGYQILKFQGRQPNVTARELAFEFPRYFNEEMAVDLTKWWAEMLATGKVNRLKVSQVGKALRATRDLMRPMLLEKLWAAVEAENALEAEKLSGAKAHQRGEAREAFDTLRREIDEDFVDVAHSQEVAPAAGRSVYERYAALARELGQAARPRPPKPVAKARPKMHKARPPSKVVEKPRIKPKSKVGVAPQQSDRRRREQHLVDLRSGGTLVAPYKGWLSILKKTATAWIGTPYVWGGVTMQGVDCSGFVRGVYRSAMSVNLPRNSRAQYKIGRGVKQKTLSPGDLVFFDTMDRGRVTHVGLYLGGGEFVHASSSKGVTEAPLKKKYYQRAYIGARRVLDL